MDRTEPRPRARRIEDTRAKLENEVDCWVASADDAGNAYLTPLSFYWDGTALVIATPATTKTARNLLRAGWARIGLGGTRDVVIVEGAVEQGVDRSTQDAHTRAAGFDAREEPEEYVYLRIRPATILAWREANELRGRVLMRDGDWLPLDP